MTAVLGMGARLRKLRAMSTTEIFERIRYRVAVDVERRRYRRGTLVPPDRLARSLVQELRGDGWQGRLIASRQRHRTRFFSGVHDPVAMRRLFETTYRREGDATRHEAARARQHCFEFFGQQFQYGETIDWQEDPVSRRRWPETFHADVPVNRGDIGSGDVKHVWELNRQQFLIDLGKAYFLDGNAEDVDAVRRLVKSWIAGNPYATGVNWACALEPAFRVFSWLWAYYLTQDGLDDAFHLQWLSALHDHGRFLSRHLEHYSSPYNHLMGEAAALYMLGACFPEFVESKRWKREGRAVLEQRLHDQFYADGGSVEQSTFYHHATVGFLLLAGLTARSAGEELPGAIWRALERGLEFSTAMIQPDGTTPRIGGADDGKPIRMEHLPLWDFRPYQAVGAVLFNRGDFKVTAGRFHEDALWLLGPAGLDRFRALPCAELRVTSTELRASGYYVLRSAPSSSADYVCFDCGEQAAGMRPDAIPNSMHGHADCLSVIAWLGGRPVLVDSGLYAYNCGGPWEAHFRETAAHNTARVDGRDQALHIGKMAWSHSYRPRVEGWTADGAWIWVIGSHDGFARGSNGVTHRRAVSLRAGEYLLIYDEFVGRGEHELEVNYQFAPGSLARIDETRAVFDDAVDFTWLGSTTWTSEIQTGGVEPSNGWIAESLGVRQAAPRLRLRTRIAQPHASLVTAMSVRQRDGAPRVEIVPATDSRLLAVRRDDETDWIAARGISAGGPIDTDACLAMCTLRGSEVVEAASVGGSFVRADASWLTRLSTPAAGLRAHGR